jgi:hypothetical protein
MAPRTYVYYRVRADDVASVASALRSLHARWMATTPALRFELLRRADHAGDDVTLMEVYAGVSRELQQALDAEAAERVARWLVGSRQREVFAPCA